MINKLKKAFTLGEMLIALSVIGTVSVLILPQLVVGQKAARAQAQFSTAYAILSKMATDMDYDGVTLNASSYSGSSAALYTVVKKYARISVDCGNYNQRNSNNDRVCRINSNYYKTLTGGNLDGNSNKLFDKTSSQGKAH